MTDRFWSKVDRRDSDECWNWLAADDGHGYGAFGIGHATVKKAHRVAYELEVGPIPAGLDIDHLCRNRKCVNPAHLEPVTHRENMVRGLRGAATHCPKGHEYAPRVPGRRRRQCLSCFNAARRARYSAIRSQGYSPLIARAGIRARAAEAELRGLGGDVA